jgi:hypothetical protein
MRISPSLVVLIILIGGGPASLRAQGGLEALGGLGGLVGSFISRDAYVGSVQVSLLQLRTGQARVSLHGFSMNPPAGPGWYIAFPLQSRPDVVQTIWFVQDPHRFTIWGKHGSIRSRPRTFMIALQYYGASAGDFAARVRDAKSAEWRVEGIQVLSLDAHAVQVANVSCAEYTARLIDRRVPYLYHEQPFVVTLAGRACPHPDAPALTVDVSQSVRSVAGETPPAADSGLDGFLRGVSLDAFHGPTVERIARLDNSASARGKDESFRVTGVGLGDGVVWITHQIAKQPMLLSRVDSTSGELIAQIPVEGALAGVTGQGVWITRDSNVWRVDPALNKVAEKMAIECSPHVLAHALQAGDFGMWFGCRTVEVVIKKSSPDPSGFVRRLDPATGSAAPEIELRGPLFEMRGTNRTAWALTAPPARTANSLAEIDPETNRLIRTIDLGTKPGRYMEVAGNEAWMVRSAKDQEEVIKLDLDAGSIAAVVSLPRGRRVRGLAIAADTIWVSTDRDWDPRESVTLGSAAGLLRINRSKPALQGSLIPTGTAARVIGLRDGILWLYDNEGTILCVRSSDPDTRRD